VLVGIFIGIGVLVLFAAAVAGGIFLIMRSASSGPAKRSISRRAPRDDYEDRPRRRRRPD
jgi:hypothetical protein